MKQEEKHEYSGEYDENNDSNSSSHKRYYESISEKRSSSPERSRKRSRRDRSSSSSSRSRSPDNYKRIRYYGTRENPNKSSVLGVFGLSNRTLEPDLKELFSSYGPVEHASIVYDSKTRKSRGFGFIYFRYIDDASKARRDCNGMKLDGRTIRVDYSITKRAHTPTPGIYMGIRQSRNDVRSYYGSRSSYRRFSRYSSRRSRSYSR